MSPKTSPPDPELVLRGLKDFQRDTVEYVFKRLYLDSDTSRRFLIADEVGLGKTLVARGLIARAIDHLWQKVDRIDIVYICSNVDIARQNINRLNVTGQKDFNLASRITLLPVLIHELEQKKLNFISFTPGTSFDLKSNLGIGEERALLYWLLQQAWGLRGAGPLNVFQGDMGKDRFRWLVDSYRDTREIDRTLMQSFVETLERHIIAARRDGQPDIRTRFNELCNRFSYSRMIKNRPPEDRAERNQFIGELRILLAETCLTALKPDLIILDEFQRFKHLLEAEDSASSLARGLFDYSDDHSQSRVILLSATPYKMYTLHDEADEDHYRDFLRTIKFLQQDSQQSSRFEQLLEDYRRELLRFSGDIGRLREVKQELEAQLRRVMVRTEKLAVSEDRNGMLVQIASAGMKLEPQDLDSYITLQGVAKILEQGDTMEYWKSAPYLLNFMDDYEIKRAFKDALDVSYRAGELACVLSQTSGSLLSWRYIESYKRIDPANARLRSLMADTLGKGAWRLLWIPPSLPYYKSGWPFSEESLSGFTKRLVFSSWRVVPKAVALMLSYEAERQMIRSFERSPRNTPESRKRRRPLLRFASTDGRLTGMPVLGLLYPSVTLARECDPLDFLIQKAPGTELLNVEDAVARTRQQIEKLLNACGLNWQQEGNEDESWYWAGPILLDLNFNKEATHAWFQKPGLASIWSGDNQEQDEGESLHWFAHVDRARDFALGRLELGRPPVDLASVLAHMALAGPGVVALRSLTRIIGGSPDYSSLEVLDSAAGVAHSFRHLFNVPEVMAMVRGLNPEEPYWRRVLEYCVAGGLQSVLDEYAHILCESLGLLDQSPEEVASEVSRVMNQAITLRTSNIGVDEITIDPQLAGITLSKNRAMRGRFALRFGEEKSDDSKGVTRKEQVREAFNSPFWPFVLVTTSVGQEGLDFHPYCHAVVHWNLPCNPVDLEQREGRVHRYKGHAVRKNLALLLSSSVRSEGSCDPWEYLFKLGVQNRGDHTSDLVPFWVFPVEGGSKIERHIPAFPLSRELDFIAELRQALAVYRMVFGQNRQEDLLSYLLDRIPESSVPDLLRELRMDLMPNNQP
jgi:hypothetical protein